MKKHIRKISSSMIFLMLAAASLPSFGQEEDPVAADADTTYIQLIPGTAASWSPENTGKTCITSEDFNQGLILNAEGLVAGRFQGLLSRLEDGSPSSDYSLESLRNSSFWSSLSPLLVVDGVPVIGIPDLVNPHDIESITWLNGNQAAGYGSLGRNGALLIETMKGRKGLHVSYSGQVALSTVKK